MLYCWAVHLSVVVVAAAAVAAIGLSIVGGLCYC